ncbi:MAG: hypothetical protein J0L93_06340 [Deltaproteobacteria bacterium]|nr:hypothetical protein [Deltaproteobacteria bacterium]
MKILAVLSLVLSFSGAAVFADECQPGSQASASQQEVSKPAEKGSTGNNADLLTTTSTVGAPTDSNLP